MSFIYFSEQEKQAANESDIVSFLQRQGQEVKRCGREYMWDSPSGKVSINGSEWYSQYERVGGGAVGLVYHVRSNIVYPRGQNAFDGWSILWYEAWASDRRVAKALWRKAAAALDWSALETAADTRKGRNCCDPDPVAPSVSAIFLAAAARACDDPETAERLEALVDARYLRRENGRLWLDLDPLWRIGATAARLTSLAESRGSRFRRLALR